MVAVFFIGSSITSFSVLVLASVCWSLAVIIVLPRVMGRIIAIALNRVSQRNFRMVLPLIYIYPLAGRMVVHSMTYTDPNGSIDTERIILQCRWYRTLRIMQLYHLLSGDETLSSPPIALNQPALHSENYLMKRLWYIIRKYWCHFSMAFYERESMGTSPFISIVCVCLRGRVVNNQTSYVFLRKVINIDKSCSCPCGDSGSSINSLMKDSCLKHASNSSLPNIILGSRQDSAFSAAHMSEVPFSQRVLTVTSLEMRNSAFYFCDMGRSPAARIIVGSAKVRYNYGAAPCKVDKCRKQIQFNISKLALSTTDGIFLEKLEDPSTNVFQSRVNKKHTDYVLKCLLQMGYEAINDPFSVSEMQQSSLTSFPNVVCGCGTESDTDFSCVHCKTKKDRGACGGRYVSFVDLMSSTSTIVEYLFDEPGVDVTLEDSSFSSMSKVKAETSFKVQRDEHSTLTAPIRRVSVVLRGCAIRYDWREFANLEHVWERLHPSYYDLLAVARTIQFQEEKRLARGLEIDIEVTPIEDLNPKKTIFGQPTPMILAPYFPRSQTWHSLVSLNVRKWYGTSFDSTSSAKRSRGSVLPRSQVSVCASRLSIRTVVPYEIGMEQKYILSGENVKLEAHGVVKMPLCNAKRVSITKLVDYPLVWNDTHVVTTEVHISNSQFFFLPDTLRIAHDFIASCQKCSIRAPNIRYFIPFKERTIVHAKNHYSFILSCCHNNIWEDIHSGIPDQYGRIVLTGHDGALVLNAEAETEFFPFSTFNSFSLSLPNIVGQLELWITEKNSKEAKDGGNDVSGSKSSCISRYSIDQISSLMSQNQPAILQIQDTQTKSSEVKKHSVLIPILKVGRHCCLSGSSVTHIDHMEFGSTLDIFLDSVNMSNMSVKLSSLVVDINPHHIPHFMNLIRNYTGWKSSISSGEGTCLSTNRTLIIRKILSENRYATREECHSLGLSIGMPSSLDGTYAMDVIVCMDLWIDSVLIRLHDMPNAISLFDHEALSICSVICTRFSGKLCSSRVGLDMHFTPKVENSQISIHGEYIPMYEDILEQEVFLSSRNVLPYVTVDNLLLKKRILYSKDYGMYFSEVSISICKISGSFLDTSAASLLRIVMCLFVDSSHEDIQCISALFCIECIDVYIKEGNILLLSPSSVNGVTTQADVSKDLNSWGECDDASNSARKSYPLFLTAITNINLPLGFRYHASNCATEEMATQARWFFPLFTMDVFMSWGSNLIPWNNNEVTQAQVLRSSPLPFSTCTPRPMDKFLLRNIVEAKELMIDIVLDSRPALWSKNVKCLQRDHVLQQHSLMRNALFRCFDQQFADKGYHSNIDIRTSSIKDEWWVFLEKGHRASILRQVSGDSIRSSKGLNCVSVLVSTEAVIFISIESLELAHYFIDRAKGHTSQCGPQSSNAFTERPQPVTHEKFFPSDVLDLWHFYEEAILPKSSRSNKFTGVSIRALETRKVSLRVKIRSFNSNLVDKNESALPQQCTRDELIVSFPLGIHLLRILETKALHSKRISFYLRKGYSCKSFDKYDSVSFHASVPSLSLCCNEVGLCQVLGVTAVIHEPNIPAKRIMKCDSQPFLFSKERALIGNIISCKVGYPTSSIQTYASLGRILSSLLVMSTNLFEAILSLRALRMRKMEGLCRLFFLCSSSEFLSLEPVDARLALSRVLTNVLYLESNSDHSNGASAFPCDNDIHHFVSQRILGNSLPVCHVATCSFSLILRNISLTISGSQIIHVDVFSCKGSIPMKPHNFYPILDGLSLHASFGIVCLSFKMDVIVDALQMISEVVGFVRGASILLPIYIYYSQDDPEKRGYDFNVLFYSFPCKYDEEDNVQVAKSNSYRWKKGSYLTHRSYQGRSFICGQRDHRQYYMGSYHGGDINEAMDTRRYPEVRSKVRLSSAMLNEVPIMGLCTIYELQIDNGKMHRAQESRSFTSSHTSRVIPWQGKTIASITAIKNVCFPSYIAKISPFEKSESRKTPREGYQFSRHILDCGSSQWGCIVTAGEALRPLKRAKVMVPLSPFVPPVFPRFADGNSKKNSDTWLRSGCCTKRSKSWCQLLKERPGNHSKKSAASLKSKRDRNVPLKLNVEKTKSLESFVKVNKCTSWTVFLSCGRIKGRYFRETRGSRIMGGAPFTRPYVRVNIYMPRISFMSSFLQRTQSLIVTITSIDVHLQCKYNPKCKFTTSLSRILLTSSRAHEIISLRLPKLIYSVRISNIRSGLYTTDLQLVGKLVKEFNDDIQAAFSVFASIYRSYGDMASDRKVIVSTAPCEVSSLFYMMGLNIICEHFDVNMTGFHPEDEEMKIAYALESMYFSCLASERASAVLTLGLRVKYHRVSIASYAWKDEESVHFPSFKACGVKWSETICLPTILKVTAKPVTIATSVHGICRILFTYSGLVSFRNICQRHWEVSGPPACMATGASVDKIHSRLLVSSSTNFVRKTPFSMLFSTLKNLKDARLELSCRSICFNFKGGEVIAFFKVQGIDGIFEWNTVAIGDVQLCTTILIPNFRLYLVKMPFLKCPSSLRFPKEDLACASLFLDRLRIDLLRSQTRLSQTFIFRITVSSLSGQLRPWVFFINAAMWADECNFLSDLLLLNELNSFGHRTPKSIVEKDSNPFEEKIFLVGLRVQELYIALPLLNSEAYTSSRLALHGSELRLLARHYLNCVPRGKKHTLEMKIGFFEVVWKASSIASSCHSRIVLGYGCHSADKKVHKGFLSIILDIGAWRIFPRKDVVLALREARILNIRNQTNGDHRGPSFFRSGMVMGTNCTITKDYLSNTLHEETGHHTIESFHLKIFNARGLIEGLEGPDLKGSCTSHNEGWNSEDFANSSALCVPAFSVAVLRKAGECIDLVDLNCSSREGKVHKHYLQKVGMIFTEIFRDTSPHEEQAGKILLTSHHEEVYRDVSILVRFGTSLYGGEEDVMGIESKIDVFAGKFSAFLFSFSSKMLSDSTLDRTFVFSGISPKLALQISPLLNEAKLQSLRLFDVRFFHGSSTYYPGDTLFHISRAKAMMDAKSLLLAENRIRLQRLSCTNCSDSKDCSPVAFSVIQTMVKFTLIVGNVIPPRKFQGVSNDIVTAEYQRQSGPGFKLQIVLPSISDVQCNQAEIFVERTHFIACRRRLGQGEDPQVDFHTAFHGIVIRGQWDIIGCKLLVRENLSCYSASRIPGRRQGIFFLTNITNRLQFESMQYGKNTSKLNIDAIAIMWVVPHCDIVIESTIVQAEVSYTMKKGISRLYGQLKRLRNEIKLLAERDLSKQKKKMEPVKSLNLDSNKTESNCQLVKKKDDPVQECMKLRDDLSGLSILKPFYEGKTSNVGFEKRMTMLKGEELIVVLRGYQFHETRRSAVVQLLKYDFNYQHDQHNNSSCFCNILKCDFSELKLSYNDEERDIFSNLCSVPSPQLTLSVSGCEYGVFVELLGSLEIQLGHGFYYWKDFKKLFNLTIMGIAPAESGERTVGEDRIPQQSQNSLRWGGRLSQIRVNLNPKIDVIGDLTTDMLQMMTTRLMNVDTIPMHMNDYIIVPVNALSLILCNPLLHSSNRFTE